MSNSSSKEVYSECLTLAFWTSVGLLAETGVVVLSISKRDEMVCQSTLVWNSVNSPEVMVGWTSGALPLLCLSSFPSGGGERVVALKHSGW